MHAHEQERFVLRYTSDLYVIRRGPTLELVVSITQYYSEYKLHVWDQMTQKVVWQSAPSERYGSAGV